MEQLLIRKLKFVLIGAMLIAKQQQSYTVATTLISIVLDPTLRASVATLLTRMSQSFICNELNQVCIKLYRIFSKSTNKELIKFYDHSQVTPVGASSMFPIKTQSQVRRVRRLQQQQLQRLRPLDAPHLLHSRLFLTRHLGPQQAAQ